MKSIVIFLAVLVVAGGGAYLLTAPSKPDPKTEAVVEALALHTRALQAALSDECSAARKKLNTWNKQKKAGTPNPDDDKQARKALRKMIKEGCKDAG